MVRHQIPRLLLPDIEPDEARQPRDGRFGEHLLEIGIDNIFGRLWTREGLSRRDRSLVAMGILIALRATEEFRGHVTIGLNNGLTEDEIAEVIYHASGYAGFPNANSALNAAREVLKGRETRHPPPHHRRRHRHLLSRRRSCRRTRRAPPPRLPGVVVCLPQPDGHPRRRWRLIAPDLAGFDSSATPSVDDFGYTFAAYADFLQSSVDTVGLDRYRLWLHDYGSQFGFQLALAHPERVASLVIQNGDIYEDAFGLKYEFLKESWNNPGPDRRKIAQHVTLHGFQTEFRGELPADEQAYLREHRPPTLIVWGPHDGYMPEQSARAYHRDLPDAPLHLLGGHWLLETTSTRSSCWSTTSCTEPTVDDTKRE